MSAAKLNLTIEKGARFDKTLNWQDSSNTPIDLANYLGRMQIRERKDSTSFVVELTTENGMITLQPNSELGRIDLYIGATTTDALTISNGVYDLELYHNTDTDDVVRLIEGNVTIAEGVTR